MRGELCGLRAGFCVLTRPIVFGNCVFGNCPIVGKDAHNGSPLRKSARAIVAPALCKPKLCRINARRSREFHRGIVRIAALTVLSQASGRAEPVGLQRRWLGQSITLMRILMGPHMTQTTTFRRRATFLVAASALLLAPAFLSGAAQAQMLDQALSFAPAQPNFPSDYVTSDDGDAAPTPERLRRAVVAFDRNEAPGTIVIDTGNTALYYVLGQGRAIRYGVGVGREGFTWSGVQTISRKAEWPDWHPPAEMIARQPYLPRFMAGGPGNPLGARAMYLGTSQYRIHGTNDPTTIGKFVSSGCIRLTNEDVADLFSRVDIGTKVVVLPKNTPHLEARGTITIRPTAPPSRPVVTTLPSGRQAMSLSRSSLY